SAQCASGFCVDGRCCSSACAGTCQTCATGACSSVVNADDDTCMGANTCNATGTCVKRQGQLCTTSAQCASGFCVDGRCCSSACTGTCQTCANASGVCSAVTNADDD